MANIKITELTELNDPDSTDVLPIVDVGEDVTKKVSIADLLKNAGSGTEALPGIAFDGDPSTGIYRPGAGQLAISSNGTERVEFGTSEVVFNDGGANYDFRIEGDTSSSLFFVDASANAVGIGTAIPDRILDIESAGSAEIKLTDSTNIGRHMYIKNNDGAFEFRARDRNSDGSFVFLGYGSGVDNEFMRINSSGKLLVGTSSQSGGSLLQVNDDRIRIASSKTPASASDTGTAGEICWDSSYIYVCTATDTWKRAALSTW